MVKFIIPMEEVGDDIGTGYVISFSKCIKYGVGVIVGGNVGWYFARNVVDSDDIDIVDEVGSGDDGGA